MLNDILDYYKEEADIDVTGYYLDEDTEIYLTENKEIYFGSKEGIKKGTYEVLKFKSDYLSDPVINYTLEGKTKFANTHSIKYYNDTCLYIKNIDSKVLSKCPKYGDLCPPDKINTNLKSIEESELKYLKNIE